MLTLTHDHTVDQTLHGRQAVGLSEDPEPSPPVRRLGEPVPAQASGIVTEGDDVLQRVCDVI
jgi:hypothetical protein